MSSKFNVLYESPLSDADKVNLSTIIDLETELNEKEMEMGRLRADIQHYKKKLSLSWPAQIKFCLDTGTGHFILKTPIEISNCIAQNFSIQADRDMKNNVATNLSIMHANGEIGKCIVNEKSYYGLMKYFEDKLTLKANYGNVIEMKMTLA